MSDDNVKSIVLEPDWAGMRRWLLSMYRTDPAKAREIAEPMGREAPSFTETWEELYEMACSDIRGDHPEKEEDTVHHAAEQYMLHTYGAKP